MSFAALAALPVKELAAPTGCHLFLWTSGPFLPQALRLIEAWGFKYSTRAFTWLKTEIVLLARRGNCRRRRKDVRELILAPRREHSRKPNEFYARVEAYCDGPFVDLFARERRPGWHCWGDEVTKYGGST
jgi:N6-adenosine-specific RNA methylase IME4